MATNREGDKINEMTSRSIILVPNTAGRVLYDTDSGCCIWNWSFHILVRQPGIYVAACSGLPPDAGFLHFATSLSVSL
jgi:hypothetical protein